jgi:uncharacterized membrane protein (DUF2068 family)
MGSATRAPGALRWIIAIKVFKALALVAFGVAVLVTRHTPPVSLLADIARALHLPLASHLVQRAMDAVMSLTPTREVLIGLVSFAYGGLFATEGVGLFRRASWARWLTVVATGALIPLEVYEIAQRPTALRIVALLVNIAVVGWLVRRKDVFE